MKPLSTTLKVLACTVFILTLSSLAQAQATRTWVSGLGDDLNPCSRTAPCKTFAGAISKTAAGGEINCIDPGGFGAVTITKSITIDGGGTFASILAGGTNGVNVNDSGTPTPNTIVVTLRRISIDGAGPTIGVNGVNFTSGKILNIENCTIFNFSNRGVSVALTASGGTVNIKDTNIFQTVTGVRATTTSGFVSVSLDHCRIENNTSGGITLATGGFAHIRDSVINFNGTGIGITGSGNLFNLERSEVNSNTTGLSIGASTSCNIGSTMVMSNSTNFSNSGTIRTFANNETDTVPLPGAVTNLGLK